MYLRRIGWRERSGIRRVSHGPRQYPNPPMVSQGKYGQWRKPGLQLLVAARRLPSYASGPASRKMSGHQSQGWRSKRSACPAAPPIEDKSKRPWLKPLPPKRRNLAGAGSTLHHGRYWVGAVCSHTSTLLRIMRGLAQELIPPMSGALVERDTITYVIEDWHCLPNPQWSGYWSCGNALLHNVVMPI